MNFQYSVRVKKMLFVILIIELVVVEMKIQENSKPHHENALLRRLHGHRHHKHHHEHTRRGKSEGETTTGATVTVPSTEPPSETTTDASTPTADFTDRTTGSTELSTDPPTTTESPELALEAKQLAAKIEKEMEECETASLLPEVEYTPPSMPPHIDRHYFHVTQRVPYYTVGPVDPVGYDPSAVKLTSCEKIYRKHVQDDLYSEDEPETEESLEITRLPKDKKKRDKVLRDMFEFSDEFSHVGETTGSSEKESCRRRSH